MTTIGERIDRGISEVKWRMQPTGFVVLEHSHFYADLVRTLAEYFTIKQYWLTRENIKLSQPTVAQLRGTTNRLYVIGERFDVETAKFERAYYTTPESPFDDNHAFLRVTTTRGIQDAHFYKQNLIGVSYGGSELPVKTPPGSRRSGLAIEFPGQIMFLNWIGLTDPNSVAYAGINIPGTTTLE